MTPITLGDADSNVPQCRECGDGLERVDRTFFLRLLIGSKRYRCRRCQQKYLYFLGYLLPF